MIADALFGYDPLDKATEPAPAPRLLETALSAPPVKPAFAFVKPPGWEDAAPETRAAIEELAAALGDQCFEVDLPPHFEDAAELRERINFAEMARCYHRYMRDGADQLAPITQQAIRDGAAILAKDYLAALDWREVLYSRVEKILERADADAITLPVFTAENGLPMGAQLVGARGHDGRLLRTANWLFNWLDEIG